MTCECGHSLEDHRWKDLVIGGTYKSRLGRCGKCVCEVYNPKEVPEVRGPGRPRKRGRPPKVKDPASDVQLTDYAIKQLSVEKVEYTELHSRIPVKLKETIRAISETTGADISEIVKVALTNELERWTA